jgi:hypothetical protein
MENIKFSTFSCQIIFPIIELCGFGLVFIVRLLKKIPETLEVENKGLKYGYLNFYKPLTAKNAHLSDLPACRVAYRVLRRPLSARGCPI